MKKSVLRVKIKEVFQLLSVEEKIDKALNSKAIDIEAIPEDDYRMAKNICIAILEDAAGNLRPLHDVAEHRAEINNIKLFI